jgi:pimeloyl-ACP methyl ester carboxylesterase
MQLVKTKSFEIAVIAAGDPNAAKLAIITPGRLDTKDYAQNVSHINFLAGLGYYAVSFDPPGTWDSPGPIGIYTTTSTLTAIDELIDHFGNRPTLLMGHSRGGTVSILAGARNKAVTHMISVCSSYGGVTKVARAEEGQVTVSPRDIPPGTARTPEAGRKVFDLPYSYFEDSDQYNALDILPSCTKPMLFFYGTHDDLVRESEVRKMYAAAAGPKEIKALETDHDYRLHPEIIEEVERVAADFLKQNS